MGIEMLRNHVASVGRLRYHRAFLYVRYYESLQSMERHRV